jgi:1-acyl-sn-glycerol-3-phosphate acyltransferase
MRFGRGDRLFERLAGAGGGRSAAADHSGDGGAPALWRTRRHGAETWEGLDHAGDQTWLRGRTGGLARETLQQALLFPATRLVARPTIRGADDLYSTPQPAVIAANHSSDLDTPLILSALPRSWRTRTLVGAAEDRFYRRRRYAISTELWIGTFAFDRGAEGRGLAQAATLLRDGMNVLLYPQGTRSHGLGGFRAGVARLAVACDVPIVPVHVGGTALLMPKDRGLTQRGRCTVTFGPPLHPDPAEEPRDFAARLSAAIARLALP